MDRETFFVVVLVTADSYFVMRDIEGLSDDLYPHPLKINKEREGERKGKGKEVNLPVWREEGRSFL